MVFDVCKTNHLQNSSFAQYLTRVCAKKASEMKATNFIVLQLSLDYFITARDKIFGSTIDISWTWAN